MLFAQNTLDARVLLELRFSSKYDDLGKNLTCFHYTVPVVRHRSVLYSPRALKTTEARLELSRLSTVIQYKLLQVRTQT